MGGWSMRRFHSINGMETPVSMFLLLSAALLIASIGGIVLDEEDGEDDLFRIRTIQAGSMGKTMSIWEPESGKGSLVNRLKWSNYTGMISNSDQNSTMLVQHAVEFLQKAPDGLDCCILIGPEEMFEIQGSHVQWRSLDHKQIRIIVPLRRGSVEVSW
jgi:hypothetical protein